MTPTHLSKIKKTLLELNRSPKGIKASTLAGLAQELGRAASIRGKEPTYVRDVPPRLPFPLSIPRHTGDLRVGTATNIIKSLLKDVAVWEAYMQGNGDEY